MNNRGIIDLIITLLPGLTAGEKIKVIDSINNEDELLLKSKRNIEELLNRKINRTWDINELRDKADRIDTISRMRFIKWVSWTSAEYPPLLREIYDPPAVLFYKGILPDPEKSLLGVVGTRKPSQEALDQAYKIAHGAGTGGLSVVSGLARGIDAMAHRGNIAGGASGYAILGSGVDEIYPSSNRPLAKKILDSGGAIISEYLPGTCPSKWRFPARNRIIAGLSRGVLIVEAPQKSGALITAYLALNQGKDIWTASSGIQSSDAFDRRGTIKLFEDGAEVVYSHNDIFEKWNMNIADNDENAFNAHGMTGRNELVSSMANFLKIEV